MSPEKVIEQEHDYQQVFYTTFEPKVLHRFLFEIYDKEGSITIPTWLIHACTRPSVCRENNKWVWNPIKIKTYDPIVPSAAQMFFQYTMQEPTKFDIKLKVIGCVGDVVELWEISNAEFTTIDFGNLDWCSYNKDNKSVIHQLNCLHPYKEGSAPVQIEATIKYEEAILAY